MSIRPTSIARGLRRNATDVEKLLWYALRDRCAPWKFRRQHPVGRRVVDFACPAAKLAIELDGGQHTQLHVADRKRTLELSREGYRVIRFWNNDVTDNIDGVLESILLALEKPPPHPALSAPGGGEGNRKKDL